MQDTHVMMQLIRVYLSIRVIIYFKRKGRARDPKKLGSGCDDIKCKSVSSLAHVCETRLLS